MKAFRKNNQQKIKTLKKQLNLKSCLIIVKKAIKIYKMKR